MGWPILKSGTVFAALMLVAAGTAAGQDFVIPDEQMLRSLSLDERAAMERRMTADARSVRQMILNLVSNAIKYAPEGSRVGVGFERNSQGAAVLSVRDTGGSMPEEIQSAVNVPWSEDTSDAHMPSSGGTGLGLTITKILAAKHGAVVHADSHPDRGTTFEITFPVHANEVAMVSTDHEPVAMAPVR